MNLIRHIFRTPWVFFGYRFRAWAATLLLASMFGCGELAQPDTSGSAKDLSAAAVDAIADASASNSRAADTVAGMDAANLQSKKPQAVAQIAETGRALGKAKGSAEGAGKAAEKQALVIHEQLVKIREFEASDPVLGWIRLSAYALIAAGVAAGIAAIFLPAIRGTLLAAGGASLAAGFALAAIARYLRTIEFVMIWTIAAVAVCGAAVGLWLLWKWFQNHKAGLSIAASMEEMKQRGKLRIGDEDAEILDSIQTPAAKRIVDSVQATLKRAGDKTIKRFTELRGEAVGEIKS